MEIPRVRRSGPEPWIRGKVHGEGDTVACCGVEGLEPSGGALVHRYRRRYRRYGPMSRDAAGKLLERVLAIEAMQDVFVVRRAHEQDRGLCPCCTGCSQPA